MIEPNTKDSDDVIIPEESDETSELGIDSAVMFEPDKQGSDDVIIPEELDETCELTVDSDDVIDPDEIVVSNK